MTTLRILSWSESRRWAGENSWPLSTFVYRLGLCISLKGTELKRTARALKKKELVEVSEINPDTTGALIHALESLGAEIALT